MQILNSHTAQIHAPARHLYFIPEGVQSIAISMSVYPLAYLKNHTNRLHKFFCLWLPMRPWLWLGPPDNNAIPYVLPVMWMMSCFHVTEGMGQNQRWHVHFVAFARWCHWGQSLLSPIASCFDYN